LARMVPGEIDDELRVSGVRVTGRWPRTRPAAVRTFASPRHPGQGHMGDGYGSPSWADGASDAGTAHRARTASERPRYLGDHRPAPAPPLAPDDVPLGGPGPAAPLPDGPAPGGRAPVGSVPDEEVWEAELVDAPWDPVDAVSAEDVEIVDAVTLEEIARDLAAASPSQPGDAAVPAARPSVWEPAGGGPARSDPASPARAAAATWFQRGAGGSADAVLEGPGSPPGSGPVGTGSSRGHRRRRGAGRQRLALSEVRRPAWARVPVATGGAPGPASRWRSSAALSAARRWLERRIGPVPLGVVAGVVVAAVVAGGLMALTAGRGPDRAGAGAGSAAGGRSAPVEVGGDPGAPAGGAPGGGAVGAIPSALPADSDGRSGGVGTSVRPAPGTSSAPAAGDLPRPVVDQTAAAGVGPTSTEGASSAPSAVSTTGPAGASPSVQPTCRPAGPLLSMVRAVYGAPQC
jgi:hypothetical protein